MLFLCCRGDCICFSLCFYGGFYLVPQTCPPVNTTINTFSVLLLHLSETELLGGPLLTFLLLHIETVFSLHFSALLPTRWLHDSERHCDIIYVSDKITNFSKTGTSAYSSLIFSLDPLGAQKSLIPGPLSNKCTRSLFPAMKKKSCLSMCWDTESRICLQTF